MSSSSLEKLRALTDKLEDRIAKKRAAGTSPAAVEPGVPAETQEMGKTTPVSKPEPSMIVTVKEENAEKVREENIERVHILYDKLKIYEKCPDFDTIFAYKAMNLSGIGLKDEDFGVVREGKYIQVIAITYEPDKTGKKKAKNVSLGYFGKGDTIDPELKNSIIEFVLRWRYEKAFQNLQHYKDLLARLDKPKTLF